MLLLVLPLVPSALAIRMEPFPFLLCSARGCRHSDLRRIPSPRFLRTARSSPLPCSRCIGARAVAYLCIHRSSHRLLLQPKLLVPRPCQGVAVCRTLPCFLMLRSGRPLRMQCCKFLPKHSRLDRGCGRMKRQGGRQERQTVRCPHFAPYLTPTSLPSPLPTPLLLHSLRTYFTPTSLPTSPPSPLPTSLRTSLPTSLPTSLHHFTIYFTPYFTS